MLSSDKHCYWYRLCSALFGKHNLQMVRYRNLCVFCPLNSTMVCIRTQIWSATKARGSATNFEIIPFISRRNPHATHKIFTTITHGLVKLLRVTYELRWLRCGMFGSFHLRKLVYSPWQRYHIKNNWHFTASLHRSNPFSVVNVFAIKSWLRLSLDRSCHSSWCDALRLSSVFVSFHQHPQLPSCS